MSTVGRLKIYEGATWRYVVAGYNNTYGINVFINNGGYSIMTGTVAYIIVPFSCTIQSWNISSDSSGSIVVDVKKSDYNNFPVTTSIAGSELPTLSSTQKNQDLAITTWTTDIYAGDILEFYVNSASAVSRVIVELIIVRK